MAQKLIQTQEQKLQQLQKLSAQQMLQVKLLEMPLTELEDSINAELDDNPALESENPDDMLANDTNENDYLPEDNDSHNNDEEDDYEAQTEKEEREDALDSALENIGRDDLMPDYNSDRNNKQDADYEEMVYGDTISFYDKLKEQMDMQMLDDTEKQIMEYLIGSLDDDGLLRKDLDSICDELAIYQNIDVSEQKLEKILHILQTFDPAGIGARNLQECLLLQVKRMPKGVLRKSMEEVFTDYYNEFTKKHWDKIKTGLELNDTQLATLQEEIRKLNPKPGASLGETEGRNLQQITPDFIVDTNDDGTVTFSLNRGNMPELTVSTSFIHSTGSSKLRAFVYGVLSGIVEPIAGILTILAIGIIEPVMPYLLSFAAGAMIYVVIEELVPEMSEGGHSNRATIAFMVGFCLMMTLDVMLG